MMINVLARTKLADRPIHWEEKYSDDYSAKLKRMYTEIIGKGSYFRFEGRDAQTGDEYVVIVGPSSVRDPECKFFAGTRKLPFTYPAGGETFSEMKEAINKAVDTWGITMPSDIVYYDSTDLRGLKEKVEAWHEMNDDNYNEDEDEDEDEDVIEEDEWDDDEDEDEDEEDDDDVIEEDEWDDEDLDK